MLFFFRDAINLSKSSIILSPGKIFNIHMCELSSRSEYLDDLIANIFFARNYIEHCNVFNKRWLPVSC